VEIGIPSRGDIGKSGQRYFIEVFGGGKRGIRTRWGLEPRVGVRRGCRGEATVLMGVGWCFCGPCGGGKQPINI